MTDNDEETLWMQGSPLNDVIGDLEATPCPVPVLRVEPRSFDVDSLIRREDTRSPALPDTLSMTSPALPDTLSMTSPALPDTLSLPSPDSPAPRDTTPAPDSPAPFDLCVELDIQQRHEERAIQLLDEYAAAQIVEEDERAARERLTHSVKVYEQVSSDEETMARWLAAEDCRPQELYSVQRARYLSKRRSSSGHQHEYPAKRGGDSPDALVVVRYPGIDTEFTVRRFGIQEMEARHGELSQFRRAWLDDYHADQRGYHGDRKAMHGINMYYVDHIYRAQFPVMYEELYYVDLFFRSKFYATFGKRRSPTAPKPLYIAWCTFVNAYIKANTKEVNAYEMQTRDREERFYSASAAGVAMQIHALSIKLRMPCTVPVDVECPSCYSLSGRAVIGARPPSDLAVLHARLQDILKQGRTATPAPIEHEGNGRLEDEVAKLRAEVIKLRQSQANNSSDESKERAANCEVLQARDESLQRKIAAEVAAQLSQHFRSMASNVLSNNTSC